MKDQLLCPLECAFIHQIAVCTLVVHVHILAFNMVGLVALLYSSLKLLLLAILCMLVSIHLHCSQVSPDCG